MTHSARRRAAFSRAIAAPVFAALIAATGAGAALASDQSGARKSPRLVSVNGVATRDVTPDMATITLGVNTKAANAADALKANAQDATKLIAAIRAAGVESKDIRTNTVSLSQNYRNRRDSNGNYQQEPDGFNAANTISVRVRDLGKLGALLTASASEGANRINNLAFDFAGRDKLAEELQGEAVKNARSTAERLVTAAGAKLGEVQSIAFGAPMGPVRYGQDMMVRAAAPAVGDVPVEAGEMTISVNVQTTWVIE